MKKGLVAVCVLTSIMFFSGCGGSGGGDTTPPRFNLKTYSFDVDADHTLTLDLAKLNYVIDEDKNITFKVTAGDATIEGSKLIFSAGSYKDGDTVKKVKVVATDSANNSSLPTEFTFNIKMDLAHSTYALKADYIAATGAKQFKKIGGYLEDPSGLLWDDKISTKIDYTVAREYCKNGWRLPTRDEFLNIIDYSKGNSSGTKSLIDNNFKYSDDTLDASWIDDSNFVINHKSGAEDTGQGIQTINTVLCVYGKKATTKTANLNFTPPDTQSRNYQDAKQSCEDLGKRLPTINELRSAINYNDNTISMVTVANDKKEDYYIWSSTEWKNSDKNDLKKRYFTVHMKNLGLMADIDGKSSNNVEITHYTTCVDN